MNRNEWCGHIENKWIINTFRREMSNILWFNRQRSHRIDFLFQPSSYLLCVLSVLARDHYKRHYFVAVFLLPKSIHNVSLRCISFSAISMLCTKWKKKPFADWFTRCIFILSCINLFKNNWKRREKRASREQRIELMWTFTHAYTHEYVCECIL